MKLSKLIEELQSLKFSGGIDPIVEITDTSGEFCEDINAISIARAEDGELFVVIVSKLNDKICLSTECVCRYHPEDK